MLITKEQQEALVHNYIKSGRNLDECVGFIDGVEKAMELITRLYEQQLKTNKSKYKSKTNENLHNHVSNNS